MKELAAPKFALGEFTLDPAARELRRGAEPVPLANLPFRVLVHLVEHRDRVVTRDELIERFWDGKDVYDDTLRKCMAAVRKALGDSAAAPHYVETRHREGYRYVGPCAEVTALDEPAALEVETTRAVGIIIERGREDRASRVVLSMSRRVVAGLAVAVVAAAAAAAVAFRPRAAEPAPLPAAPAVPRSIAVLPLETLSGDEGDDFLGDGLAESLIGDLSRVHGLRVISRRSAFAIRDAPVDPREVGRRLGVEAFLEGTLRRSGDSVHVDVRLVSTEDGRVLWVGGAGERLTGNVLDVQEALACEVAAGLRVTLCGEGERVSSRYTRDPKAYREYLAGRYHWNRRRIEDMREAVDRYEAALAADPNYALAYAGLAETYAIMEANGNVVPGTVAAKGEAAARRALELDPTLPGAWAALGLLSNIAFDWETGDRYLARALELNPGYASARQWYAHALLVRGRFTEAEAELLAARDIDPLSYPIANSLSELFYQWRQYDRAIAQARIAAELNPSADNPYHVMATSYVALGRTEEALEAAAHSDPVTRNEIALRVAADRDAELRYIEGLARSGFGARMPYSVACLYARSGDVEAAVRWLERACETRQADAALLAVAPELDVVRAHPRYPELVRRVGLE
jgi:TolB-like protein/DNA-binding winged helix-turn-helix (wHTH) protein/tetratricopeptide (TPR) repeat protein